jgi:hypothetical protein
VDAEEFYTSYRSAQKFKCDGHEADGSEEDAGQQLEMLSRWWNFSIPAKSA